MPTPAATAAARPSSNSNGLRFIPMGVPPGMGWFIATAWFSLISGTHPSDGHVHDFLVRIDQAVADFDGGAEGDLCLVRLEHHLRQLQARLAALEARGEIRRLRLRGIHGFQPLLEYIGEAGAA